MTSPLRGPFRGWPGAAAVAAVSIAGASAWAWHPPALGGGASRAFAVAASGALTLACLVPVLSRPPGRSRRPYLLALILLAAGLGAYRYAAHTQEQCTARSNSRQVVIGTEWTQAGRDFAAAYPDHPPDEVLVDAAGDPYKAWTAASIERCRLRLATTTFWWIPLLTASVGSVLLTLSGRSSLQVPAQRPVSAEGPKPRVRYDAFISYRHGGTDADVARQLLDALEADGYRVAIDVRDFAANERFLVEMERCIRESRFTIAIVSARYLESGHCEEEAILCRVLDMGERRRRLIPFVIQPVPMPAWLFGIVGVDCTKTDVLIDPLQKVKATLGPPLSAGSDVPV